MQLNALYDDTLDTEKETYYYLTNVHCLMEIEETRSHNNGLKKQKKQLKMQKFQTCLKFIKKYDTETFGILKVAEQKYLTLQTIILL